MLKRNLTRWSVILVAGAALAFTACDDDSGVEGNGDAGADCGFFGCSDLRTNEDMSTNPPDTSIILPDTSAPCLQGNTRCADASTLEICNSMSEWEATLCIAPDVCNPELGMCGTPLCPTPGLPYACETGTQERVCSVDQLSFEVRDCEAGETCTGTACGTQICVPRARRCKTSTEVEECNEAGTLWEVVENCAAEELCGNSGQCQSLCEVNAKTASFLGCEYYVVDLDNIGNHDQEDFGVTVSNPHAELTATVTIFGPNGTTVNDTVAAGALKLITLPTDTDVEDAGVYPDQTFKLNSSIPVTVHQFNPVNGDGVFSNDASLLLPINALGREYMVMNHPTADGGSPETYVDLVGTVDGTTVTINSPEPISGAGLSIPANTDTNITIGEGDLVHLIAIADCTGGFDLSGACLGWSHVDITGMRISASEPIAALAGNECMNAPSGFCCCDHTESQLFPVETWGTQYVAAKSFARGTEIDRWRIIAAEDNTTVTLSPTTEGISTFTLNAGQVQQIDTTQTFEISADKKILVGQYWASSTAPGITTTTEIPINLANIGGTFSSLDPNAPCDDSFFGSCGLDGGTCQGNVCGVTCGNESTCEDFFCDPGANGAGCRDIVTCTAGICQQISEIGDPAYSLAVPTVQFRSDYIVLTPPGYEVNYVTVVARRDRVPLMDDQPITNFASPQQLGTAWDVYRFEVSPNTAHSFVSGESFGITAYGYNAYVSYAYPGGLNLEIIN